MTASLDANIETLFDNSRIQIQAAAFSGRRMGLRLILD
jgi:hypothetical protein